jgi:hypothetical protein
VGSSVHHLEGIGTMALLGAGGFGETSMTATSGKAFSTATDNALTVGTVHLTPQMPAYVNVQDGATLNTIGDLHAGTTVVAGSLTQPSVITVTGAKSRWRAGDYNYIGGIQGPGSVVVDASASITDGYNFFIGAGTAGAGNLLVQGGGTVNIVHGMLGHVSGSNGTATITGDNSA